MKASGRPTSKARSFRAAKVARARATRPGLGVKPSARSLEQQVVPSRRGEAAVKKQATFNFEV